MNEYLTKLFLKLDKLNNDYKDELKTIEQIKYLNYNDYQRQYKAKNKDRMKQYYKNYYEDHKDTIKENQKKRYENIKDNLDYKQRQHDYYIFKRYT